MVSVTLGLDSLQNVDECLQAFRFQEQQKIPGSMLQNIQSLKFPYTSVSDKPLNMFE